MEQTDSRECRNCHGFDYMNLYEQGLVASEKHRQAERQGRTCIECHQGISHRLPEAYVAAEHERYELEAAPKAMPSGSAAFLYELNTNLSLLLKRAGLHIGQRRFDRRLKYLVLGVGLVLSAIAWSVMVAAIYPPAILGREIYYGIALGGFGAGMVFFVLTLLFDLLVARRGFCRYLCPGGALYSLLGRYRPFRIQRVVENCNDCAKCNAICEFGMDPLRDGFGQECNNCTACIAVCPTDALTFKIALKD